MVVRNTKWSQNFRGRGKITWPHSYIRLKMEQTCDQHCVERFETLISSGSVKARKSPYQRYYSILYYMYLLRTWIYLYTVFHYSLPNYLSVDMERIQKRVHSIVYPRKYRTKKRWLKVAYYHSTLEGYNHVINFLIKF